jgi:hypothetical protein
MLALEVLQICPSQRRTLLLSIGAMDMEGSNLIMFNLDYFKERISHHLDFQIQVLVGGKNTHHIVLDEGVSTRVMSLPCWRALGSPKLASSPTTLKVFDGRGFQPQGIFQYFPVTLKGKTVLVDIEVVHTPVYYNFLLGRSCFYTMNVVASMVFRVLRFLHQVKIITVDQLDY